MSLRKKFLREDWLHTGVLVLAEDTHTLLQVKNLCTRMNVTKGSFYHHFRSWDDYIDSLLDYIYNKYTVQVLDLVDKQFPYNRIETLTDELSKAPFRLAVNIRCWAQCCEKVRSYQAKTDRERIAHLIKWHSDLGLELHDAEIWAKAHHMAYIGMENYALYNADFDANEDGIHIARLLNETFKMYLNAKRNVLIG